jgi:uncharacterized protein (DUF885 family)
MTAAAAIEALAGELADVLLSGDPFGASFMSVPGYDDTVPDLSPHYQQTWRGRLVDIIARGAGYEADALDAGHRILLETARDTAARELAAADSRVYDFSVTTFPLGGPSLVLLTASRASVSDPHSARAYLARCRQLPVYLDQHAARLRAAARDGLAPVAPLVSDAIRQLQHYLSHPERDPLLAHRPPQGWAGAAAWREDVEGVVRDEVRPAMGRYAGLLAELLPRSRRPEQAGLLYVPGGIAAYACCVRNGTTLPFDPDELHRLGLAALAEIEEQIGELGRRALGAADAGEIMIRFRKDPELAAPDGPAAMARAATAIARAQERQPELFRSPLPPPCAVDPMPPHMAEFGAPPYYSPPARDGSRPGAYLFNDVNPGQAGSWALEATAFHEGVPGHHAQFARVQLLPGLPLLLSGFYVVPHGEGWGLYAERLADEFGLYSDDLQRMGMLGSAAFRAVRLVVDTGLHARGWSRARAREFALAHSPMPEDFIDAEIDRYIALPGQALGYLTGQREILRLREEARSRLGAAFDIRDFHSAVLDHGSLPLPVLRQAVADWTASAAGARD